MLDLSVDYRQLTQGREPAEMVLAVASAVRQTLENGIGPEREMPGQPTIAQIDVQAVARCVYDLMHRELLARIKRLGGDIA